MNTLDKVYDLTIDIKNIDVKYNSYAKFFDDDRETSVIRIKLLNDKTPINLENCIVEAYFILADNTYHNEACKIINSSEGIVELQLCQKCLVKGENIVRLSILKDNEISNTPVITYEVRKGLYSDNPSFNDDPLTPILSQMLLDIKITKINQIELQERYEKSLPKIEGKIKEVESLINRVDTVIASGTQDLEVKEARDGEVTLKARLDRDIEKAKQVYINVEGSHISTDSSSGYLKDVEILGNTIQDASNLADIRSVGEKVEGQDLYEIPILCTNGLDNSDNDYEEHKLTILSPTQLEKVGDVADRLIEKDGVWGVEKNIGIVVLNGSENWYNGAEGDNTNGFTIYSSVLKTPNLNVLDNINDKFKSIRLSQVTSTDTGFIAIKPTNNICVVNIPNMKSKEDCLAWLKQNNVKVKYVLATPQFIPLPHSQQVKLRTFANKTNISFLTEIEGMIKAQVPKSLGATVNTHTTQISNLNKELDRVKKLEESTVSTVETESDFTTIEATSNGYFEDVKLEGKTLVNLINGIEKNIGISVSTDAKYDFVRKLIPNTTYTLSYTIKDLVIGTSDGVILSINKSNSYGIKEWNVNANGNYITTITTPSSTENLQLWFFAKSNTEGFSGKVCDVVFIEGDHTQNPPSYFEGLKSVGQDVDEIVVSSVKGDGNLFDMDNFSIGTGSLYAYCKYPNTNGLTLSIEDRDTSVNTSGMYIGVTKIGVDASQGNHWCLANQTIENRVIQTDFSYVSFYPNNRETIEALNKRFKISVYLGKINKPHIPHQADKKRLLFYNNETQSWEKPILRQWDSIEKHSDGKYYYHQRSGEVVLNGSESWTSSTAYDTTMIFTTPKLGDISKPASKVYCDKINDVFENSFADVQHEERIKITQGKEIAIMILKSKLSTQDAQGFKQWLQANNVTVVYQLAEEKVYECTNIDLITYEGETNYIVESGVISPKSILKVHNNISNVVSLLQKKVSLLESNMTKYMITQNRMQLASTYSADSVTFKVDYALCSEEVEYNEDLYNLILNNILVGKDNYNYDKMFTMILDYASWNQISWEQFDILVGLMDIQHNPPIEEIPTDDEIVEEIPNEIM